MTMCLKDYLGVIYHAVIFYFLFVISFGEVRCHLGVDRILEYFNGSFCY